MELFSHFMMKWSENNEGLSEKNKKNLHLLIIQSTEWLELFCRLPFSFCNILKYSENNSNRYRMGKTMFTIKGKIMRNNMPNRYRTLYTDSKLHAIY